MNALATQKSVRIWTYIIGVMILMGLFVIFGADLVRALQGR